MWVFCCGMFRSASTLQFQITCQIIKEFNLGKQVGWIEANRFWDIQEAHANYPGFKVIKVHLCTNAIAWKFTQNRAIGIYTFRDIRDSYASYMQQLIYF